MNRGLFYRGLFFDGRRDKTIVQEKKGIKLYKKVISKEHVSLLEEPNSKFLGHVTPKSGTGKDIADSILAVSYTHLDVYKRQMQQSCLYSFT